MKESNENEDALMAAKAKFNNTREAVTNFVSQINTVINHVRFRVVCSGLVDNFMKVFV